MIERPRVELTRGKIVAIGAGVLAAIVATVGVTVAVEHRVHDHDGHEEHAGHGESERGESKHGARRVELGPKALEHAALEILTAGPGRVAITLELPGEIALNADATAHVTPRVAGTVREVKKQVGDDVKKGDVLAILDSRELAEMQRELLAAQERLVLAEGNFKRLDALWQEKIAAEKDYLAAKQGLAEARIEHRSAAQKLGTAGRGAGGAGYSLVAPLDGTILEKHATVGEVLKDETQAFLIADLSRLWVNVTVYAKDLARVHVGQPARVRAEGIASPAHGTIAYVGQVVGEQTRSATARVVLATPGPAWRPGLFVAADVAVEQVDAPIVVVDDAVQRIEGKEVVFVEEGGAFEARPVKLGRRGVAADATADAGPRPALVEVVAGLAAGDRYVAKNSFLLKAELGKSEAGHEH